MNLEFYVQDASTGTQSLCQLDVFSDEIAAASRMPLDLLVDRMSGSLVCLAARKGNRGASESSHIRPLCDAEGQPVPLVAKSPTLAGLLRAIEEDEFSPDW